LDEPPNDWSECFKADKFTGPFQIIVKKNNPKDADMLFSFPAFGTDGETKVRYALEMVGRAAANLPPEGSTDIKWTTFDIHHERGPGNKVACSGTGSRSSILRVTKDT